jgi:hypothetical protein
MSIKVAVVSMVKNECDIIELFIKLNSRFVDAFYFLDHYSTDGTVLIIEEMRRLGYNVSYQRLSDDVYNQSKITTGEVRRVAALGVYDYVMPLDADEFIKSDSRELFHAVLSAEVSRSAVGYIPWVTYCPVNVDYFNVSAPLYHNFRQREFEPDQYFKVVVGADFARHCSISMGNHSARNIWKKRLKINITNVVLQHVPVRSTEQIIRKAILGSHAFSIKKNRKKGEGFHWDLIADLVRGNNYSISADQLLRLGMDYATKPGVSFDNRIIDSCVRIGSDEDLIEFKKLSQIDLIESFDSEIERLCTYIKNRRFLNVF